MILTGPEIASAVRKGTIVLDPFDEELVNANSYNFRLGPTLLEAPGQEFDVKSTPDWQFVPIPPHGYVLSPGGLYLAHTVETIGSDVYVPSLIGRSSIGRLGLFLQVTADLGHIGAVHQWTLELYAVQPVRVHAGMRIGQMSFWATAGERVAYTGPYSNFSGPAPNVARDIRPAAV